MSKELTVMSANRPEHPFRILDEDYTPPIVSDGILREIINEEIKIKKCPKCGGFGGEIVIKTPECIEFVRCPRCGHMSKSYVIHHPIISETKFATPITAQSIMAAIKVSIKDYEEGVKMNELQIFKNEEFGSIRTVEENGKVLFCGKDIAEALGYSNLRDALMRHCRYVVKRDAPHPQSASKQIEMSFIPEGDVYRLITHSKLPSAEKFERWVFDEVLPSIRKRGGYIAGQESMSDSELMAKALLVAQRQIEDRNKLIASQEQIIGELSSKAEYVDIILNNKGLVTITQIAKDYGMSGANLNRTLADLHIQYKQSGQWLLYSAHQNKGWTHSKTINITRSDGRKDVVMETKWTQKGRLALYELLKKNGILPTVERD